MNALGGCRASRNTAIRRAVTVITTANTTNAFPAGRFRPDLTGDPSLPADERTLSHWFNTARGNPAAFTFGTAGRCSAAPLSPRRSDAGEDCAWRQRRFALRIEAHNLFNRTNSISWATRLAPPTRVISSARAAHHAAGRGCGSEGRIRLIAARPRTILGA